jgi:DinB superfamily
MKMYEQDELLNELSNQTENILKKTIAEWQFIPHMRFARKPSPEGWSANECLQHLNSYGRYYLPAIEDALNHLPDSTSPAKTFSSGWLGDYFTRLMLPGENERLSKKMKSPKDHAPQAIVESHLVISEFIDQQEKLLQLLTLAKKKDLNKRKVGISIAPFIKLKVGDVFMFLIAHIVRHTLQADRALAQAGVLGNGAQASSINSTTT